jgi:hypothetical protein
MNQSEMRAVFDAACVALLSRAPLSAARSLVSETWRYASPLGEIRVDLVAELDAQQRAHVDIRAALRDTDLAYLWIDDGVFRAGYSRDHADQWHLTSAAILAAAQGDAQIAEAA